MVFAFFNALTSMPLVPTALLSTLAKLGFASASCASCSNAISMILAVSVMQEEA